MSAATVDFRLKLPPRTHAVLTAVARASGRDMAEVAREVLDCWAEDRVAESTLVLRLTASEGLPAASGGGDA